MFCVEAPVAGNVCCIHYGGFYCGCATCYGPYCGASGPGLPVGAHKHTHTAPGSVKNRHLSNSSGLRKEEETVDLTSIGPVVQVKGKEQFS